MFYDPARLVRRKAHAHSRLDSAIFTVAAYVRVSSRERRPPGLRLVPDGGDDSRADARHHGGRGMHQTGALGDRCSGGRIELLWYGQGLTGESGFVELEVHGFDQPGVGPACSGPAPLRTRR